MKTDYKDYFKQHYHSRNNESDITTYGKWFYAQWRIIKRSIVIKPHMRVLEIGSGFGGFYSFLLADGITNYVGIELDEAITTFANDHFKTSAFRTVSIEKFKDNEGFDLIFAFEVLEHLENPSEALDKIASLLRPGGIFCGTTPYPYKRNVLADQTHLSVLHPLNWKRLFERSHLKVLSTSPMSFFPVIWRLNKNYNVRLPFFLPIFGCISTCLIIAGKPRKISQQAE